jgi:hypothetical protein
MNVDLLQVDMIEYCGTARQTPPRYQKILAKKGKVYNYTTTELSRHINQERRLLAKIMVYLGYDGLGYYPILIKPRCATFNTSKGSEISCITNNNECVMFHNRDKINNIVTIKRRESCLQN